MKTIRLLSGLLITIVTVGTSMLIVSYKPQTMEFKSSVVSENKSIQELLRPYNPQPIATVAGFDIPLNYIEDLEVAAVTNDGIAVASFSIEEEAAVTDNTDNTKNTDNTNTTTEKKSKVSKETDKEVKKEKKESNKESKDTKVATPRFNLTSNEISILERITEAEATGGSIETKMNVANVIVNRVSSDRFPNSVEAVVFQKNPTQFSPTSDGRYWSVTVTKETKEAVQRMLVEADTTNGALYFCNQRDVKSLSTQEWFKKLTFIKQDSIGHSFFK